MLRHVSPISWHISVDGQFFPTSMLRRVNMMPRHISVYHSGSSWMSQHMTLMPRHISACLSSALSSCLLFLLLSPKCMFFLMIPAKCVERGIMTNSHDLGVKFTLKAQNECIRCAQMICNFTPNIFIWFKTSI